MTTRAVHPANHALDWVASAVPAVAVGWAAGKVAPLLGYPLGVSIVAAGLPTWLIAYAAMRRSGVPDRGFTVATFVPPAMDDDNDELLLDARYGGDDELLLDARYDDDELILDHHYVEPVELLLNQPFVERTVDELAELLLDDPLAAPSPDSRVVRLFAPAPMPSAGDLAARIDRHLGHAPAATEAAGGHDALKEALDELRRSLRRA